jgi:hypothetical protein
LAKVSTPSDVQLASNITPTLNNIEIPKKEEQVATNSSVSTPVAMLNTQINIVHGDTIFASNEEKPEYAPLIEKQFNYI